MMKYEKECNITYFKKIKELSIDEVNEGDIVYLKVNSPLNYGIRELEYWGKIIKKTNCFFWITEYGTATWRIDHQDTDIVKKHDENVEKYTKKWEKKSICELWIASTEQKIETRIYECSEGYKNA